MALTVKLINRSGTLTVMDDEIGKVGTGRAVPSKSHPGLITTPEGSKELNFWDRRRWVILKDFWMDRISKEHADHLLERVTQEERDKGTPND